MNYLGVQCLQPPSCSSVTPRLEMPARRISSLSVGVNKVTGAADAVNCLVFPVQANPLPSQFYDETAKEVLPFLACEILPKKLIFKVCWLLLIRKTLAWSF